MQDIESFITEHYATKADFARDMGVFPQQVTKWINNGYTVCNGVMYKPMRDIPLDDDVTEN